MIKQKTLLLGVMLSFFCLGFFSVVPTASASALQEDIFKKTDEIAKTSFKTDDKGDAAFARTATRITQILLGFMGTAAVILIIYAGFLWTTAGGNDDQVKRSKKIIMQVVIGIVVASLAYAIITFVITQLLGSNFEAPESTDGAGSDETSMIYPYELKTYELS